MVIRCVPIDQNGPASCFHCGVDAFEIGEFSYMVRREVWLAAVRWTTLVTGGRRARPQAFSPGLRKRFDRAGGTVPGGVYPH